MRKLLLVRPEPGLSASAARAQALGLETIGCPLFEVEAVGWALPDAGQFDALMLTSANAVRHAGLQLQALTRLPVYAVGAATADAATAAGLSVAATGNRDVEALLSIMPAGLRLLHLAGEDRIDTGRPNVRSVTVYRSRVIENPALPDTDGVVIGLHSPRAARRLAELVGRRYRTRLAAISKAAADAAGRGWEEVAVAEIPADDSLLALAAMLCHKPDQR
jgi:uroporphyrinogen-III synthase